MALIYAMLLGADCIDDCEVMRGTLSIVPRVKRTRIRTAPGSRLP